VWKAPHVHGRGSGGQGTESDEIATLHRAPPGGAPQAPQQPA
jgi:hypothetical protein